MIPFDTDNDKPEEALMYLSIIVAMSAREGIIGCGNSLPAWDLPSDLKRFRNLTEGGSLIMGRKTFDSIVERNGGPLPGRTNIVLSARSELRLKITKQGGVMVSSTANALAATKSTNNIFVIGGSQVYGLFLPFAKRILMTKVYGGVAGDRYFPKDQLKNWKRSDDPRQTKRQRLCERDSHETEFCILVRR